MAQTTFTDGVTLIVAAWLNDVDAQTYTTGTTATTLTWDGSGGTSASITLTWKKIGSFVILNIPAVTATTGTGSTVLVSNTALAAAARPTTTQYLACNAITNNGAAISAAGILRVRTDGGIQIQRDNALTAFTNSAVGGLSNATTVCYFTA